MKIIQVIPKRAKSNNLIFSEEPIAKCVSDCCVCYNEKVVCEICTEKGHTNIVPSHESLQLLS